jgi:AraC-like DNA-binding protein
MKDSTVIALEDHYFGDNGFPIAVRLVRDSQPDRSAHKHDLTFIEHAHQFNELVIVTSGRASHTLEGRTFPITAGDVFVLQRHQRHFYEGRDFSLVNVMYHGDRLGLMEESLRCIPGYTAMFRLEPTYRKAHRFSGALHLDRADLAHADQLTRSIEAEIAGELPGFEAVATSKFQELIVYLARKYSESGGTEAVALLRVGDLIGRLEKDLRENWTLEKMQSIAHMSRTNLIRTFRRATGQPPVEYLIRLRIQAAIDLLTRTDDPITTIAFRSGFNDSNYFTRQFRKAVGVTPRDYRKQYSLGRRNALQ